MFIIFLLLIHVPGQFVFFKGDAVYKISKKSSVRIHLGKIQLKTYAVNELSRLIAN